MSSLTEDWVIFVQPSGAAASEAAKELARRLGWQLVDTDRLIMSEVPSLLGQTSLVVVTWDPPEFTERSGRRMKLRDLVNGDVV